MLCDMGKGARLRRARETRRALLASWTPTYVEYLQSFDLELFRQRVQRFRFLVWWETEREITRELLDSVLAPGGFLVLLHDLVLLPEETHFFRARRIGDLHAIQAEQDLWEPPESA